MASRRHGSARGRKGPLPGRPLRPSLRRAIWTALAALGALGALAIGPASAHEAEDAHAHAFLELGPRVIDGRAFLAGRPGVMLEAPGVLLMVAPTLNLDFAPAEGAGPLRVEDWDEASDWGRLLRTFSAEGPGWRLRAGPLAGETLGHGTLVDGFVASWDPDRYRTAAALDWTGAALRVEALAGAVLTPGVTAVRAEVAPLAGRGFPIGVGPHLGLTAAADLVAPVTAPDGPATAPDAIDPEEAPVAAAALDLGWVVWRGERLTLSPYVDGVLAVAGPAQGRGAVHLGLLADVRAAPGASVAVRGEARRVGAGWTPEYFDAFYMLERRAVLGGGPPRALAGAPETGWGGYGSVAVRAGRVTVETRADVLPGGPARATLGVGWGGERFDLRTWVGWRRTADLLQPEAFLAAGELRWDLDDTFWLAGRAAWLRREDPAGGWRPAADLGLAVGGGL